MKRTAASPAIRGHERRPVGQSPHRTRQPGHDRRPYRPTVASDRPSVLRAGGAKRNGPLGTKHRRRLRVAAKDAASAALGLGFAIAVEQAERHVEAEVPLVVVDAGPVEETTHVDAVVDRLLDLHRASPEAPTPPASSSVPTPCSATNSGWPGKDSASRCSTSPRPSLQARTQRPDSGAGRIRPDGPVGGHAIRGVVREPDEVERVAVAGHLDRPSAGHLQLAVLEAADPAAPVDVIEPRGRPRTPRAVSASVRIGARLWIEATGLPGCAGAGPRRSWRGGSPRAPRRTGRRSRRPGGNTPSSQPSNGVGRRLVHRLPAEHLVAEGLGHEVDVAGPVVRAAPLVRRTRARRPRTSPGARSGAGRPTVRSRRRRRRAAPRGSDRSPRGLVARSPARSGPTRSTGGGASAHGRRTARSPRRSGWRSRCRHPTEARARRAPMPASPTPAPRPRIASTRRRCPTRTRQESSSAPSCIAARPVAAASIGAPHR